MHIYRNRDQVLGREREREREAIDELGTTSSSSVTRLIAHLNDVDDDDHDRAIVTHVMLGMMQSNHNIGAIFEDGRARVARLRGGVVEYPVPIDVEHVAVSSLLERSASRMTPDLRFRPLHGDVVAAVELRLLDLEVRIDPQCIDRV